MKLVTGTTIIHDGRLIDGTGRQPIPDAAVVVADGRILDAGPAAAAPPLAGEQARIDARGATILPGLVEAHFHATYFNVEKLEDLDIKYPVEYVTLQAAVNCRLALECGYTAARSGGCLFNCDVWLEKAIEADLIPGPRLSPSGREICSAGGLIDWNPDFRRIGMEGLVFCINGVEDARKAVRSLVKDGVAWVNTYPTGDAAWPDVNDHHTLCMTFEEMHAVVATAHNHKLKVTGHCRATEGIKNALRAGSDCVEHATFIDDEGLELLLSRDVPVVPGLQFEKASVENGPAFGLSRRVLDGHQETLDGGAESCRRPRRDRPAATRWRDGATRGTPRCRRPAVERRLPGPARPRRARARDRPPLARRLHPLQVARAIRCPVRLLQADPAAGGALADDECAAFAAAAADCTVERFPGIGHGIHWAEPERVRAAAATIMKGLSCA